MLSIDICLSPRLLPLYFLEDKTVVVADIFRATSCMVAGLGSGVRSIIPTATIEECLELKQEGFLTAGERKGIKVPEFDLGNSPFEYMRESNIGKTIAVTTTNGTQAIDQSRAAKEILIGSFLNLEAIANYLLKLKHSVVIVCAGWREQISMEDTLFAGALAELVIPHFSWDSDSVLTATSLHNIANPDMFTYLHRANHFDRLLKLGFKKDLQFCLNPNQFDIVPYLKGREIILK